VRDWKIDFDEQAHINNARNWMAAACQEIKEIVSLNQCGCGKSYEQWGRRPAPPCATCEKIRSRKTALGEKDIEQVGREGKRAKYDHRDAKKCPKEEPPTSSNGG